MICTLMIAGGIRQIEIATHNKNGSMLPRAHLGGVAGGRLCDAVQGPQHERQVGHDGGPAQPAGQGRQETECRQPLHAELVGPAMGQIGDRPATFP